MLDVYVDRAGYGQDGNVDSASGIVVRHLRRKAVYGDLADPKKASAREPIWWRK